MTSHVPPLEVGHPVLHPRILLNIFPAELTPYQEGATPHYMNVPTTRGS